MVSNGTISVVSSAQSVQRHNPHAKAPQRLLRNGPDALGHPAMTTSLDGGAVVDPSALVAVTVQVALLPTSAAWTV